MKKTVEQRKYMNCINVQWGRIKLFWKEICYFYKGKPIDIKFNNRLADGFLIFLYILLYLVCRKLTAIKNLIINTVAFGLGKIKNFRNVVPLELDFQFNENQISASAIRLNELILTRLLCKAYLGFTHKITFFQVEYTYYVCKIEEQPIG